MFKLVLWISVGALLVLSLSARAENQASSVLSISAPSVQTLLIKMSKDAARINYSGSFTYQNQTRAALQSFKVEHWVENGQEHDRLLFLNGPEREIVREGRPVDCSSMGNKLLQGSFANLGKSLINLNNLYQFEIRGQERIAGRLARVLLVIPKDAYRYGYFLSIDEETGLVLKSWLIDENARPLERYQFVSIEFNSDPDKGRRAVSSHHHKVVANATPCNPMGFSKPELWQVAWVPSGFEFAGQRRLSNGQEMLMYTDGLTTFSIFIESASGVLPEGVGQSGATLAYMSSLVHKSSIYRVNVVGEIPVAAATKIAQSVTRL
ncbi:MAG: MucB/RseB C-terminal domain-containing protein [Pseudomonadota bacterium]